MKQWLTYGLLLCLLSGLQVKGQFIEAPDLNCVYVDTNDNQLSWTLPNPCGPFNAYYIFRSTNYLGPYTLIATITSSTQTTFEDNVGNANQQTYYYYMESDFNCPGSTVLQSDTIDNLDPVTPEINYVTVINGLAEINWEPSASPEAYAYIIYLYTGAYVAIDTVYGKNNTTYTDLNSTPDIDSMSYTVATIDSCGNTGLINDFPQHTIFLRDTVLRCTQTINLNWYDYDNWSDGVEKYDLYGSINGAPSSVLESFSAGTFSHTLTGYNDGDSLCLTIVATENISGFISTSNQVCAKMNVVQPAKDFYIRNVNVLSDSEIAIDYSMDERADVTSITIERGLDTNSFAALATFAPPADLSVINVFIDTTAEPNENSYYYRLIATDSCASRDTASTGKSVLLEGYAFTNLSVYINWDESFFTYGTPLSYELYRDDGSGLNEINSFTPDAFTYQEEDIPTSTPCYMIVAIDSVNFPNGLKDTIHSRSNILCLNQPSQIYMPNAFAPQGQNNEFKPVLNINGSIQSYSFLIFNRWGEQIFFSDNPTEGWDGKFKGSFVQQGAYAYLVQLVDEEGKNVESKGTVMVIR